MGIFDDLFGNMFDIDGDGKTDLFKETMMIAMLDEMEREELSERIDNLDDDYDDDCDESDEW